MPTVDFDIAYTYEIGNFLQDLEECHATIVSFTANGPAGGNPNVVLNFSTDGDLAAFNNKYIHA